MKKIAVHASADYEVIVGKGLLAEAGRLISYAVKGKKAMMVSDDRVFPLYGEALSESLEAAGIKPLTFVFPHGEASKSLEVFGRLIEAMCRENFSRGDFVVTLGGGVAGDLGGFAAACFQRGIPAVHVPTSLMAAVDSSVGGKTGVNVGGIKNQAGAFHQPALVICDVDTLASLPEEEYLNGCAEVIKYGVLGGGKGRELFDRLAGGTVRNNLEEIIADCVAVKRDLVEADERDTGLRMLLNFGHTLGHAVETLSGFEISHGRAVAMGMAAITEKAASVGVCEAGSADEIINLIKSSGLPTEIPFSPESMEAAITHDKKVLGDKIRLVVPEKTGRCVIKAMDLQELREWL